ncbi:MAG: hypothetical protein Q4A27_00700 [bacterium]|nr:hypothetical protein [bacterium]
MNNTYTDQNLEDFIQKYFAVKLNFAEIIARDLPVSLSSEALIFRAKNNKLYAFISGETRLTLGDVSKTLSKMNIKPSRFFPPNGYENYFSDRAKVLFLEVFPYRKEIVEDDLRFYKTRVLYNPALVEIAEIKNGEIKCYSSDSVGTWRVAKRLSYRSII